MGWVKITLAWSVVYFVGASLAVGFLNALYNKWRGRDTGDPGPMLAVVCFGGVAIISWLGYHHRLPEVGGRMGAMLSFLASLAAWAGGVGLAAALIVMLITGTQVSRAWSRGEGASALIVILPTGMAFLMGALVGAAIAVVRIFL